MKTIFSSRRRHYLARASIFLIMVALIAGMAGCAPLECTPMVAASYHVVGLKSDGTVVAVGHNWWGECNVGSWRQIIQVAAGYSHTVALKYGGTVVVVGSGWQGQRDGVGNWTDIIQVAAGEYHTVGLKANGTVVAAGGVGYDYGQCDVGNWTDIVKIAAGGLHTVGLKADDTVVAVGYNDYEQCDVDDWTDITRAVRCRRLDGYHPGRRRLFSHGGT